MAPANLEELMEQPFIKDAKLSIADYLRDVTSKTGERIVIKRFTRMILGGEE
jgi:translation elongation factor EF-Ts